jgi:hypothetical protein
VGVVAIFWPSDTKHPSFLFYADAGAAAQNGTGIVAVIVTPFSEEVISNLPPRILVRSVMERIPIPAWANPL